MSWQEEVRKQSIGSSGKGVDRVTRHKGVGGGLDWVYMVPVLVAGSIYLWWLVSVIIKIFWTQN